MAVKCKDGVRFGDASIFMSKRTHVSNNFFSRGYSWEPYANLRDSDQLHSYLIPSKFRYVNHSPERNLVSFEDFFPLLLSLMVSDRFSEVFSQ